MVSIASTPRSVPSSRWWAVNLATSPRSAWSRGTLATLVALSMVPRAAAVLPDGAMVDAASILALENGQDV